MEQYAQKVIDSAGIVREAILQQLLLMIRMIGRDEARFWFPNARIVGVSQFYPQVGFI
jgi:hypothetical protein